MKEVCKVFVMAVLIAVPGALFAARFPEQEAKPAPKSGDPATSSQPSVTPPAKDSAQDSKDGQQFSGTYTFLKEGEYVQITVEGGGQVTGFISRFDNAGNNDGNEKGTFVDQFFKSGKLDAGKLSFTTKPLHDLWFEFKGTVERGEGKDPGDEAYYVLKGTLTENTTDTQKKVTAHTQDVTFKMFPQEAEPKN